MSGTIGHLAYAVLGLKAAAAGRSPLAPLIRRHWAAYLAGSYLGCDIQTMPEAVCVDTGRETGYGTVPVERSPWTGGAVRPFQLTVDGRGYTARDVHDLFYGRAHVVFGFARGERDLVVPWDHLSDYCAAAMEDAHVLFGPGERPMAYACGWMAHIVGDALIKGVRPGLTLQLLDGRYTPRNRPIQDLVTFHELGRRELRLNWEAMLADAAETPVEPLQLHYMRVGPRRGRLGELFPDGWTPARAGLLTAVCAENRRYFKIWTRHELHLLQLRETADGPECDDELSRRAGGLRYAQMVRLAEEARFRRALLQIGECVAGLFADVVARVPRLQRLPPDDGPTWPASEKA